MMRDTTAMDLFTYSILFIAASGLVCCAVDDTVRVKRSHKPLQCRDKFEVIRNHTMCIRQTRLVSNVSEEALIEQLHNNVRQNIQPSASYMMKVHYARALAIEAQTWADNCHLDHDDPDKRFIPGRYKVGQNILTSVGKDLSWNDVISAWARENVSFHYNSSGNTLAGVGNYAQLVWADTILTGCGKADCSGTFFYVCNYAPSMEPGRLSTPYEQTAPGQAAGYRCGRNYTAGTQRICDCSGQYCLNGGSLDLKACSCSCVQGVTGYDASKFCELSCVGSTDHPRCKTLAKASCTRDSSTPFLCPWMCNVCPYAGSTYHEGRVPMPWETTTTAVTTLAHQLTSTNRHPSRNSTSRRTSTFVILFLCSFVQFFY